MRLRAFLIVVAIVTSGCLPGSIVITPPDLVVRLLTHDLTVTVTASGDPITARLSIVGGPNDGRAMTVNGEAIFKALLPSGFDLCAESEGYERTCQRVELAADQSVSLALLRPSQFCGRLRTEGRVLVCANGQPFVWRGVTAFRLLDYVADGQDEKAIAFLDWARAEGFNSMRVLAMLCCWFDLLPEDGQRALPRLIQYAHDRGIYLHLVALAGTAERETDLETQIDAIGKIAAENEIVALVEVSNEPYHGTQDERLHDGAFVDQLGARFPDAVLWSGGASRVDEPHCYDPPACTDIRVDRPWGDVITRHLDRSRDRFDNWRRLRELETVSAMTGRHVLSGEPLGFGEAIEPGRRTVGADQAYAYGVLCRIFALSCVFHMDDGLHALVPRPKQQEAAEAFLAGTRVVPDDLVLDFKNAHVAGRHSWSDSPVQNFVDTTALRVYSGVTDTEGVVIALGNDDPIFEWGHFWRPARDLYAAADLAVWQIAR